MIVIPGRICSKPGRTDQAATKSRLDVTEPVKSCGVAAKHVQL